MVKINRIFIVYLVQFFKAVAVLVCLSGCATIYLDNDDYYKVSSPDPLVFNDRICLNLDFKTDNIGEFNEAEGIKAMSELQRKWIVSGFGHYNIAIDCVDPVASYIVVYKNKSRHRWAKNIWAFASGITLGLIPFYNEEASSYEIRDGVSGKVISATDHVDKRLTSIFVLPEWYKDDKKSMEVFGSNSLSVVPIRRVVYLIKVAQNKKMSLENKL